VSVAALPLMQLRLVEVFFVYFGIICTGWQFLAMCHAPPRDQIHQHALIIGDISMAPVHRMTPSSRILVMHDSMLLTSETVAGYK